jgi:deazaflavin-dependent oxidoreductase (nitroreductase family)
LSERFIVWLSTNPVATWLIRHVFSPLDPLVYRATNGRLTFMGPPAMPMLAMTTIGRHSGRPRTVQLACFPYEGDLLVVASAMGQERHPAWRYNLDANPDVELQVRGERFTARARVLTDDEKQKIWDDIRQAIPQMKVYEKRTDRNIRVYRLSRVDS